MFKMPLIISLPLLQSAVASLFHRNKWLHQSRGGQAINTTLRVPHILPLPQPQPPALYHILLIFTSLLIFYLATFTSKNYLALGSWRVPWLYSDPCTLIWVTSAHVPQMPCSFWWLCSRAHRCPPRDWNPSGIHVLLGPLSILKHFE